MKGRTIAALKIKIKNKKRKTEKDKRRRRRRKNGDIDVRNDVSQVSNVKSHGHSFDFVLFLFLNL